MPEKPREKTVMCRFSRSTPQLYQTRPPGNHQPLNPQMMKICSIGSFIATTSSSLSCNQATSTSSTSVSIDTAFDYYRHDFLHHNFKQLAIQSTDQQLFDFPPTASLTAGGFSSSKITERRSSSCHAVARKGKRFSSVKNSKTRDIRSKRRRILERKDSSDGSQRRLQLLLGPLPSLTPERLRGKASKLKIPLKVSQQLVAKQSTKSTKSKLLANQRLNYAFLPFKDDSRTHQEQSHSVLAQVSLQSALSGGGPVVKTQMPSWGQPLLYLLSCLPTDVNDALDRVCRSPNCRRRRLLLAHKDFTGCNGYNAVKLLDSIMSGFRDPFECLHENLKCGHEDDNLRTFGYKILKTKNTEDLMKTLAGELGPNDGEQNGSDSFPLLLVVHAPPSWASKEESKIPNIVEVEKITFGSGLEYKLFGIFGKKRHLGSEEHTLMISTPQNWLQILDDGKTKPGISPLTKNSAVFLYSRLLTREERMKLNMAGKPKVVRNSSYLKEVHLQKVASTLYSPSKVIVEHGSSKGSRSNTTGSDDSEGDSGLGHSSTSSSTTSLSPKVDGQLHKYNSNSSLSSQKSNSGLPSLIPKVESSHGSRIAGRESQYRASFRHTSTRRESGLPSLIPKVESNRFGLGHSSTSSSRTSLTQEVDGQHDKYNSNSSLSSLKGNSRLPCLIPRMESNRFGLGHSSTSSSTTSLSRKVDGQLHKSNSNSSLSAGSLKSRSGLPSLIPKVEGATSLTPQNGGQDDGQLNRFESNSSASVDSLKSNTEGLAASDEEVCLDKERLDDLNNARSALQKYLPAFDWGDEKEDPLEDLWDANFDFPQHEDDDKVPNDESIRSISEESLIDESIFDNLDFTQSSLDPPSCPTPTL